MNWEAARLNLTVGTSADRAQLLMGRHYSTRHGAASVAAVLGGYAALGSLISFLGWPLDIPRFTDWFSDNVSIQPNAALLIMLSGAAVVLVQQRAWRVVTLLGGLIGVCGLLILMQYVVDADFGINEFLLFGRTWGQETTVTPGRVGPPASISFILIGTALVLLGRAGQPPGRPRLRRYVPLLGVAISVFMIFSLLGFVFQARQFYTIPWLTAIALPTSTMLLAVGTGLILSVPERDPMRLLGEASGAGFLARMAIPALAIIIPLFIWLRVQGFDAGYYDVGTSRALGALAVGTATISILWIALVTLRRQEEALRAEDRRKDEFLAMLAHELRNPLAPLTNALTILDLSKGNEEAAREARAMMSRQLKQLVRLVDDLLDLSRIRRGAVKVRKERVELQPILNEAVEAIRPVLLEASQQLSVQCPQEPVWLEVDRVRLTQVVSNLLSNASRYSSSGTPIELAASCGGRYLVISVKDRGSGIPPDRLDAVFEMFNQINPPQRASGGLGIGLYLVRRFVEMHGGTVTAHSDGVLRGSEFVVRLPVVVQAPSVTASSAQSNANDFEVLRCLSVLVVDDNADAAMSLAVLLRQEGHDTHVVHDGTSAVEAAESLRPDVILLDIGMPGLNGYEVCRSLRGRPWGSDPLIIALTGWGQPQDKQKAEASGFDAHFAKPVEWTVLARLLASRFDRPCMHPTGSSAGTA